MAGKVTVGLASHWPCHKTAWSIQIHLLLGVFSVYVSEQY